MTRQSSKLQDFLRRGSAPTAQVQTALGISKPTLSRQVRDCPQVLRIGRTRATRYALAREIRSFGSCWPIFRIGEDARAEQIANLHALQPSEWWYEFRGSRPDWLVGEFALGVFPDLPWFLDDLRPQGFMGRAFARRKAMELGLSPDPRLWDAAGILVALLLHGDDLPGNFVVGEAALARFLRTSLLSPKTIPSAGRIARYIDWATIALQGEPAGSSAAGEQPKFTACVDGGGNLRYVIVKFSPVRDTPSGQRWADLLVCEHLAATVLGEHGVVAGETEILEGGGRLFLEVARFDRVGDFGRRGFVSLMPLDAAYYGRLDSWALAADRLQSDGWLSAQDAARLRFLWYFGTLIGNTDMHFGNAGLLLDSRPCSLAPAYDMLPMFYRPEAGGEVVWRQFTPPPPMPDHLSIWKEAAILAELFWQRVSRDSRLSSFMRLEAVRVLAAVQILLQRFG